MLRYTRLLRLRSAALVMTMAVAAACRSNTASPTGGYVPPPRPSLDPTYRPSGHMAAGDVSVHLFEWRWADIASECENVLGPAGFAAVQISPPQEHSISPTYDWSERYQPVSYTIVKSRSGDSTEFVDMVNRCKAVGVGIIADAVINHMTSFPSPGIGSAGTAYTKYHYPGLYAPGDFHTTCTVDNYTDAANVQDCELLGLPDLNTGKDSVRHKIAAYLIELARLGVAGFRIDAAKHIQQVELDKILGIVDSTLTAEARPIPYYYLEIVGGAPSEALHPRDFFGEAYGSGGAADITEFTFTGVGDKFLNTNGQHISQLNPSGAPGSQFSEAAWGLMPSDKAVVFLQNHDTQHQCGLSYRNGDTFRLANVWMLAQPYGYPSILSSFAFDCPADNSMGPPSDASGWTLTVTCASSLETATIGEWVCEHRDPSIRNMVAFRKAVAGAALTHWWDNGANAIAFSRGDKGFVAINRESTALDTTVATGMAPGTYCDVLTGGKAGASCAGTSVIVDSTGAVKLGLNPMTAVAIHTGTKL